METTTTTTTTTGEGERSITPMIFGNDDAYSIDELDRQREIVMNELNELLKKDGIYQSQEDRKKFEEKNRTLNISLDTEVKLARQYRQSLHEYERTYKFVTEFDSIQDNMVTEIGNTKEILAEKTKEASHHRAMWMKLDRESKKIEKDLETLEQQHNQNNASYGKAKEELPQLEEKVNQLKAKYEQSAADYEKQQEQWDEHERAIRIAKLKARVINDKIAILCATRGNGPKPSQPPPVREEPPPVAPKEPSPVKDQTQQKKRKRQKIDAARPEKATGPYVPHPETASSTDPSVSISSSSSDPDFNHS